MPADERTGFYRDKLTPSRPFLDDDIGGENAKHYYFPPESMNVLPVRMACKSVSTFIPDSESGYKYPVGGTAFVVEGGYLVTQSHCLIGDNLGDVANRVVVLNDQKVSLKDARVVHISKEKDYGQEDIAVLHVPELEGSKGLVLSNQQAQESDPVFCIGFPDTHNGDEKVISYGLVQRSDTETFDHDSQVRPGNSGSPLVNKKGEVVGMVFTQPEGVEEFTTRATAVSVNMIRDIINSDQNQA